MLTNFIRLEKGKPTRVHITDVYRGQRTITDRQRGGTKVVNTLDFQVDRLEGAPVFATLSFISEKAKAQFEPFLADHKFLAYEFVVTMDGEGYNTEYRVQPILITAQRAQELANAPNPTLNPTENPTG